MAEPHTHGGTDAPECTTCRPPQPETVESVVRRYHESSQFCERDVMNDLVDELVERGLIDDFRA